MVDSPYLLRQVLRVGASSIAAAVVPYFPRWKTNLYRPRCPSPFCPSQLRQVSCHCAFLKLRGRPIASINNHSTIRICTLHRDESFRPLWVVATRALYSLCRRFLEARVLYRHRIRGAQVWRWVEDCRGRRLAKLGSSQSQGRGDLKMGCGNSKEERLG